RSEVDIEQYPVPAHHQDITRDVLGTGNDNTGHDRPLSRDAHVIRAARTRRPVYRDGLAVTPLRLHQQAGPLLEGRAPLLEVIVSIIGALDATDRMPQAALGHLAPDAQRGELGACGSSQIV